MREIDPNYVRIFDTTLRDGEQTLGVHFSPQDKLVWTEQMEKIGVDVVEVGFAAASDEEFEAVRAAAVNAGGLIVCSLSGTKPEQIERAGEAIEPAIGKGGGRIHAFISTSDVHMEKKLGMSRSEVLDATADTVSRAAAITSDVEFSPEDASRTDLDFLLRVCQTAVEHGATTINLPDTVGYALPAEYRHMISTARKAIHRLNPNVVISVHCHDDLGNAVSNSLVGIEAGARQVEGGFIGLGERAGNAKLEAVIAALNIRGDYFAARGQNLRHGVASTALYETCQLASELSGYVISPTTPIAGRNVFTHVGGIHQDGASKDRTTYEVMTPESVGHPGPEAAAGKLSGKAGIGNRLEAMSIQADKGQLKAITKAVKEHAAKIGRDLLDNEIELAATKVVGAELEDEITLGDWQIISSPDESIAEVKIIGSGVDRSGKAAGVGGIDALVKATNLAMGFVGDIGDFHADSIKPGSDGSASGKVEVIQNGHRLSVYVESVSVDQAGIEGYITAINMIKRANKRKASGA